MIHYALPISCLLVFMDALAATFLAGVQRTCIVGPIGRVRIIAFDCFATRPAVFVVVRER
jgi:hypothetical protein